MALTEYEKECNRRHRAKVMADPIKRQKYIEQCREYSRQYIAKKLGADPEEREKYLAERRERQRRYVAKILEDPVRREKFLQTRKDAHRRFLDRKKNATGDESQLDQNGN